jgi:hypothetical protein
MRSGPVRRHAIYVEMVSMEPWPTSTSLRSTEQGRLGTSIYGEPPAVRRRSLGVVTRCRAQCCCGQVDAEELADEELMAGSSGRAARRPGSSDQVPSTVRARMGQRRRLGRRGAAGRRRTGPAEIKASSDGRGALTHRMMVDVKSSFDGHGALTHRMVAAVQGYIQWTSREPAGGVMNRLWC